MDFINRDMLREAVFAQVDDTFDSHAIERHLYRYHQNALVRELYANLGVGTYPFTETCRQIGLELARMTDVVMKINEVSSPTFSGEPTKCALWRRLQRA
jgi:hypothetical protein